MFSCPMQSKNLERYLWGNLTQLTLHLNTFRQVLYALHKGSQYFMSLWFLTSHIKLLYSSMQRKIISSQSFDAQSEYVHNCLCLELSTVLNAGLLQSRNYFFYLLHWTHLIHYALLLFSQSAFYSCTEGQFHLNLSKS